MEMETGAEALQTVSPKTGHMHTQQFRASVCARQKRIYVLTQRCVQEGSWQDFG